MSNIRLFYPRSLYINLSGKLNKDQSKYLILVMRLNIDQEFSLFNKLGEWRSKIVSIDKGIVEFEVRKQIRQPNKEREIWLVFSPIKSNYFNFMLQKATELGVTKIFPIITERTIVRKINEDRLHKIVTEASEQSNRLTLPSIEKIQKLEKFLEHNKNINLIYGDLNTENKKIELKDSSKPICILIGPEGDFSERERTKILEFKGVQSIKLNDNILRSETAVISSLSIINYLIN
tara:strand:- start:220 stop:921 length:702 start_codon:yes stop_codon:yes gene_type:complete